MTHARGWRSHARQIALSLSCQRSVARAARMRALDQGRLFSGRPAVRAGERPFGIRPRGAGASAQDQILDADAKRRAREPLDAFRREDARSDGGGRGWRARARQSRRARGEGGDRSLHDGVSGRGDSRSRKTARGSGKLSLHGFEIRIRVLAQSRQRRGDREGAGRRVSTPCASAPTSIWKVWSPGRRPRSLEKRYGLAGRGWKSSK